MISEATKRTIESRRNSVVTYLEKHANETVHISQMAKELGYSKWALYDDVCALTGLYPNLEKVKGSSAKSNGVRWNSEAVFITEAPAIVDSHISSSVNASGAKDPTAAQAIWSLEPDVKEGEIYICKSYNGQDAMYLTIRGPFIAYDSTEKIAVVRAEDHKVSEEFVKLYGVGGKTYYIYPYEISSKPTKYLRKRMDSILSCDLDAIKKKIGDFLSIPKEVIYKTITKEKEVEKQSEPKETKEEDAPDVSALLKDVNSQIEKEMLLREIDIYKGIIEMFIKNQKGKTHE